MARPIWTGTLSFGLLNVPIRLMSGERRNDIHFRMLDQRSNTPVRYERVNADTGEEVPWKDIVKAFEYQKGSYVVLEEDDIKNAASDAHETVEIDAFVDAASIAPSYFEKPYILLPAKKAEKGYVLLRETLKKTGKIGIARVVIRTKEYLAAVMPQGDGLVLNILRYQSEIVDMNDYELPDKGASSYRISPREIEMASDLIQSMSAEWSPGDYRDEFRDKLRKTIEKRLKTKGVTTTVDDEDDRTPENATTNVVDFMALLKKSLGAKTRTPAKKEAVGSAPVKKTAMKKTAAKKTAAKKAPAKKTAARKTPAKRRRAG
ncbi:MULTISPECIES: Ku protein [Rhodanobacteraceae]|uniref:non-homologous end joining protein Ku n=1 Tax=Rhodanobacteraceae TaxID=1775411 RepID=UPI000886DE85|nr:MULTISPECIES: Ku protein [Rhodanobacteraceae]SDF96439.1 DNA end-binding protein Ku [Dyella sp. 333MFSha]SKB33157.1 DNA end-binding protein Ku [Luteibacter sp. 22Crub2.1]